MDTTFTAQLPKPLPIMPIMLSPFHYPTTSTKINENIVEKQDNLITLPYPFYYSDSYYTPAYNSYYLQGNLVSYPHIGKESQNLNYGSAGGEVRKFSSGRGYGPGERSGGFTGNFGGGFGGYGLGGIQFGKGR